MENPEPARRNPHSVTLIRGHLVLTPKYRGKVLVGEVALSLDGIIRDVCSELDVDVIRLAINPDHVHIYLDMPPELSVSKLVQKIKGVSSYELRKAFPYLKRWCAHALWSGGYYYGAVGNGADIVKRYIENQRGT